MEKIEALEEKIKAEMDTLKSKMSNMNEELRVFSDLERLRADAAEKRQLLESEHLSLGTRKTASLQNANTVQVYICRLWNNQGKSQQNLSLFQEKHNSLLRSLADNETAVQLTNLEKKWSHLEQNNFALSEFVANKKAETR